MKKLGLILIVLSMLLAFPYSVQAIPVVWNKVVTGKIYPPLVIDQVGIGTTSPAAQLSVWGKGQTAASTAFLVANQASTTLFIIPDSGGFISTASSTVVSDFHANNLYASSTSNFTGLTKFETTVSVATGTPWALVSIENTSVNPGLVVSDQASDDSPLVYDASGDMGVGTPVPLARLNVRKTDTGTGVRVDTIQGSASPFFTGYNSANGNQYFSFYWDVGGTMALQSFTSSALALNPQGNNVGVRTLGPDRQLDVLASAAPQLRLTQADGTVFTDFQTSSSGFLNITSSGNRVGIGTTSPFKEFGVTGEIWGTATITPANLRVASSTVMFPNIGALQITSDILCWDTTNGTLKHQATNCTVSSQRYKHDIEDLKLDSSKIAQLRPRSFKWNANDEESFGLIAEEVAEIYPELVIYNDKGEIQSVKYDMLSVLLLDYLQNYQSPEQAWNYPGFNLWYLLFAVPGFLALFLSIKRKGAV